MKTQCDYLPDQILQMIAKPHYEDYSDTHNKINSSSVTSLHIPTPHHRLNAVINSSNNSRNEESLFLKEFS